jgi:ribosomal protein L3
VERVDPEKNLIFVRGPVPGSRNSLVLIRKMG